MRSLDDLVLNEKLDILELVMAKIGNVEAEIEERYDGDEEVERIFTIPGIGTGTGAQGGGLPCHALPPASLPGP